jgi:Tfp pilus assembly protein PilF
MLALYHNLAASYLKSNNLKNAYFSCDEALKIDPKSIFYK